MPEQENVDNGDIAVDGDSDDSSEDENEIRPTDDVPAENSDLATLVSSDAANISEPETCTCDETCTCKAKGNIVDAYKLNDETYRQFNEFTGKGKKHKHRRHHKHHKHGKKHNAENAEQQQATENLATECPHHKHKHGKNAKQSTE